jgi:hypothetical protein
MTKLVMVGLAAAVTLLAASGAHAKLAPAEPAADDCTLGAHVFVYWGADAEAQGRVECESRKGWIRVSAVVTRDGAFVASGDHRCLKATRCRITLAPLDDPEGDQRWCVEVNGEVQGGRALSPRTFCEECATL